MHENPRYSASPYNFRSRSATIHRQWSFPTARSRSEPRVGIEHNRSFLRNQAISLALIFTCGGLATVSMMLTAFNHDSIQKFTEVAPPWLPQAAITWIPTLIFKMAAFPLTVLILYLIYRFLPNAKPPNRRVIATAFGVGNTARNPEIYNQVRLAVVFSKAREGIRSVQILGDA